jgi:hypothetical protein
MRVLARETNSRLAYRYVDAGSVVVVPGLLTFAGDRYEWLAPPVDEMDASPVRAVALAVMLAQGFGVVAWRPDRGDLPVQLCPRNVTGTASKIMEFSTPRDPGGRLCLPTHHR